MNPDHPITDICIVSDKNRCPVGFTAITRAFDDPAADTDVWKDSLFSFSRIYRYICVCKSAPQHAYVCNVVADLLLINDKDFVPTGYIAIEYTADTREKALRKKLLCVRTVPRENAVDAVCDFIILSRQKKPPAGYTLAGDLDGQLLCYKYGVIPADFPGRYSSTQNANPNLPYPIHPLSHVSMGPSYPTRPAPLPPIQPSSMDNSNQQSSTCNRQVSVQSMASYGIEGLPFELNPRLKLLTNDLKFPAIKNILESDYDYPFTVENSILADGWN